MSLYRKLTGTAGVQAAGMGLLFILHVQMTRLLGAEAYGTFIYVFAWINVAAIFGKFGADRGVVRLISRAAAHGDFSQMRQHLAWTTRMVAGFTLIAAALSALIFLAVEGMGNDPTHVTGAIGLLVLVTVTFSFLQKGALLGLGAPALSMIPTEILRPLFMIGGVVLLAALIPAPGAAEMMWLTLASYVAVIVIGQAMWTWLRARAMRDTPQTGTDDTAKPRVHDFMHFTIISVSYTVMRYTDVLLIGAIAGPEEVAYYSVAARVVSLIAFVQRAASPVVQPIISRAYTRGEMSVVADTVTKTVLVTALATLVIGAGLLVFGRSLLSAFGPGFGQGMIILEVLLVGQVINVLSGPNAAILSMTDNQSTAARALWLAAGLNVVGNLALISTFGALGAAVATAFSTLVWNVLLVWACRVKTGIDPSLLGAIRRMRGPRA